MKKTEKETLTIVVTDSGLGGLSVAADCARRAREARTHRTVDIIFYNSLFDANSGYNRLESRDEKVRVFDTALRDMDARFAPDAIMVACNTLSVLLPFSKVLNALDASVHGIVEAGVDLLHAEMTRHPGASAIIFATQTTVQSGAHRAALIGRGIDSQRIVTHACHGLVPLIERDPGSEETRGAIDRHVGNALAARMDSAAPAIVSFNCTHYGYARGAFQLATATRGAVIVATLDPNDRMGEALFQPGATPRFDETEVTVRMVSMVETPEGAIESLGAILRPISPETADALASGEIIPGMFEWREGEPDA